MACNLFEETDGFRLVQKKRRFLVDSRKLPQVTSAEMPSSEEFLQNINEIQNTVLRTSSRIQKECGPNFLRTLVDSFYNHFDQHMNNKRPSEIVCYALGRFSSPTDWGLSCRLQLILLQEISAKFSVPTWIFDPAFSNLEKAFLESNFCKFHLIQENENCGRIAETPTIFYMIHADRPLYGNLYQLNAKHKREHNVVMFGNPLTSLISELPSIDKSRIITHHLPMEDSGGLFDSALSDTVLNFVSKSESLSVY